MPMSCPVRVRQVSAAGALPLGKSTRKVIVPRSESDQIAFGVRSDRVRNPIRSRSESDWVAYGDGGEGWGFIMIYFGVLYILATFVHIIV